MHKNTTKCNKTQSKWCVNKHGASKIIDTFETYHHVLNGRMIVRYGRAPSTLATRMTCRFFTRPPPSPLAMGGRHLFGKRHGLRGRCQKTLHKKFMRYVREKIGRFLKPYKMMNGLGSLVGRRRYLLNTSRNLFNFGPSFKMCT
jgi:hypothetical protein